MEHAINVLSLILAILFVLVCFWLVRPANGTRPLLWGLTASGFFALYIAIIRTFSLQSVTRPTFGLVLCFWILIKLYAVLAVALKTRHPFLLLLSKLFHWIFGDNAPPLT